MAVTKVHNDGIRGSVVNDLPEINELPDELGTKVIDVWESFIRESPFATLAAAPKSTVHEGYNLQKHTQHVARNAMHLADTLNDYLSVECDRHALLASALLHDASLLLERDADRQKTEVGTHVLHAQLGGARCLEMGLPLKVVYLVTMHPYTPPHVFIKPKYVELILLAYADLAAVDPIYFVAGKPTHFDIDQRFFSL